MKKYFLLFIALFLLPNCSRDKNPLDSSPKEIFAIYLLDDLQLSAVDASKKSLDSLTLAKDPLIIVSDIIHYIWKNHTFSLTQEASKKVKTVNDSQGSVFGVPFVVVVGSDRIYMGAFWWGYSSVAPTFPYIEVLIPSSIDESPTTLKIEPSWIEADPDPRGDTRIYLALKKAGVLIP